MTTPTSISMRERLRTDYAWTARQKQVLELIARGRSNTEIAEALGLSLAGAKWHVSEILSKLQADQREEAADYWRRYNGLAPRFERIFRGIAGGFATKWIAGTAAVLVAGASAAVIVAIALNQSSEEPLASGTPIAGVPGTAATTPSAPATSITSAPHADRTLDVNGRTVPLRDARVLDPTDDPGALSLLVTHGCFGCDQPDTEIERVTWDGNGNVEREVVFSATERGGSYITGIGASDSGSVLVAGVCVRSYCGPMGTDFFEDARVAIYRSIDGGVTWFELTTVDGYAFPLGVSSDGEAIVQRFTSPDESFVADLPSGERYDIPSATAGRPDWPWVVCSTPYWKPTAAGRTLWGSVREWTVDVPDGSGLSGVACWGRGGALYTWDGAGGSFIGDPYEDGYLRAAWATSLPTLTIATWVRGSTSLAGNAQVGERWLPVLIQQGPDSLDLSIQPIEGPMFPEADRNRVLTADSGPFARVTGTGDCLNIRDAPGPGGTVVRCYADGVLLKDLGDTREVDGETWVHVWTTAPIGEWEGREGWASAEFLER